jgi:hypothetical protein
VLRSVHLKFLYEEMRDAQGRDGVCPVGRTYDIFEIFPDASPVWRGCVSGYEDAIRKLQDLATQTSNELRVMHVPTKTVIATLNAPQSPAP